MILEWPEMNKRRPKSSEFFFKKVKNENKTIKNALEMN